MLFSFSGNINHSLRKNRLKIQSGQWSKDFILDKLGKWQPGFHQWRLCKRVVALHPLRPLRFRQAVPPPNNLYLAVHLLQKLPLRFLQARHEGSNVKIDSLLLPGSVDLKRGVFSSLIFSCFWSRGQGFPKVMTKTAGRFCQTYFSASSFFALCFSFF